MYKFLSTGLVLIGALFINASAVASQDCDNFGVNMQNPHTETEIAASTSCINDDRSTEWHNNILANAESLAINNLDQSINCVVANCRSRLKPVPSQTSASLSTTKMTSGLVRSITLISSLDQSVPCNVANCRSRLKPTPSHPSV